jgi:hypothetical protein
MGRSPPALMENALPNNRIFFTGRMTSAQTIANLSGQSLFDKGTHLVSERALLGSQVKVHISPEDHLQNCKVRLKLAELLWFNQ